MSIPEEILKSIIWNNRKDDEAIQRIRSFEPTGVCEDCGLNVNNNRTYSRITKPFVHWREKCGACHKIRHPLTGKMIGYSVAQMNRDLASAESHQAWIAKNFNKE